MHKDVIHESHDNTLEGFTTFKHYSGIARDSTTPAGWTRVFSDADATVASDSYMTMKDLYAYDPFTCATECDNIPGCESCTLRPRASMLMGC